MVRRGIRGRQRAAVAALALCLAALLGPAGAAHAAGAAESGCADATLEPDAGNVPRVASAVVCLLNVERQSAGLPSLTASTHLGQSAEFQSRDMVARHFFDHVGKDRPSVAARIRAFGYFDGVAYGLYAENIGVAPQGNSSAAVLVDAWMNDPSHRATILDKRLRDIGVGLVLAPRDPVFYSDFRSSVYTTDFGRRYSKRPLKRGKRCRHKSARICPR
jgi:uncharacterized protein YkwD